ncbi:MAG: LuxR C-terminal-related transcriptional regulator [Acidimicrobiales bacterium]
MTLALERPSIAGEFLIAVRSETLARALTFVGRAAGWADTDRLAPCDVVVVDSIDALRATDSRYRILVIEPTPKACRGAVDQIMSGAAQAVVLADQPDQLATALLAIAAGTATAPSRAIELASAMPSLSDRQEVILRAILAGQTNKHLSRGLGLSAGSIKRELTELYRRLDAANRLELAHRAMTLGFAPTRLVA